jgi:hypothetical protein
VKVGCLTLEPIWDLAGEEFEFPSLICFSLKELVPDA